MHLLRYRGLLLLCLAACREPPPPSGTEAPGASASSAPATVPSGGGEAGEPQAQELVLLAGGDVELARATGQALLRDPTLDPLAPLNPWLRGADLRFVNLEGPLSDQRGQTMSPTNRLVFTGPPCGAEALARASIDLVSTANNHAWDYGKSALLETLVHLDRAGVRHVGTGADLAAARAPVILSHRGLRVGFLAATAAWNQGPLGRHEGRHHVASADPSWLLPAVRALKEQGVHFVAVSHHGGEEYQEAPLPGARKLHTSLIEAGADVVLGHHPHVLQGVQWHRGRPIFHSLGNLLMQMHRDHPWTGWSMMARLRLRPGEAPRVELCPLRIVGLKPVPLRGDLQEKALWPIFRQRLRSISAHTGGIELDDPGEDGCAGARPQEGGEKPGQSR